MEINIGIENMTPDRARALLEGSKYHAQRRVMPTVVNRYRTIMEQGQWGRSNDNIVIGVRPNGEHLLNGQHRLTAVAESGLTIPMIVDRRNYSSDADMDRDYSLMDRGARRTDAQGLAALGTASQVGVSQDTINRVSPAFTLIATSFNNPSHGGFVRATADSISSPVVRHQVILNFKAAVFALDYFSRGASARVRARLFSRAAASVALVTFKYAPTKAEAFWAAVCNNDGLRRGTPEHTLLSYLSDVPTTSRGDDTYSRAVAACWNAYYDGRPLTQAKGYAEANILIKGTPFNGSKVDGLSILGVK